MENVFSASEIVKMGIEIERNGQDFYNGLMQKTRDIKLQDIFSLLAQEEEKHIHAFEDILKATQAGQDRGMESDDYYAYMRSLSEQYVFTKENTGKGIAASIRDEKEAIEKAINFEKESIIFYDGIKKVVLESEKKIVDALIEQEKNHLERLSALKEGF